MVKSKIIWSHLAEIKLYKILEFYIDRNGNKSYSIKLYNKFNKELKLLIKHPEIGMKTHIESIRGLIIDDYIFFYEIENNNIIIHTVWDCRQNPDDLIIK
ncbi:MAG: type II toxin-antitoxin system RelE/ParE family toxin [Saprospiraceae bacterium]|nr:type II toxin-antitoxin system RelE/ParE family toxin [Saprospiraceae bacterium]